MLPHNCKFATVMNSDVNIWYADVLRQPLWKAHNPEVENAARLWLPVALFGSPSCSWVELTPCLQFLSNITRTGKFNITHFLLSNSRTGQSQNISKYVKLRFGPSHLQSSQDLSQVFSPHFYFRVWLLPGSSWLSDLHPVSLSWAIRAATALLSSLFSQTLKRSSFWLLLILPNNFRYENLLP